MSRIAELRARKISIPDGTDVHEYMDNEGYSDGLPLVPPTVERVVAMLSGTKRMAGEVLGKVPPNLRDVTVEKVAINAVMAGAAPKHFRVILASVSLMWKHKWHQTHVVCVDV